MNSTVPRDAHRYRIMPIHGGLDIVRQREILPRADARGHSATPNVDIVMVVACGCRGVEGDILVVAKGDEDVFLETDAIEPLGAFDVGANVPVLG